jgi:hypothetical protein
MRVPLNGGAKQRSDYASSKLRGITGRVKRRVFRTIWNRPMVNQIAPAIRAAFERFQRIKRQNTKPLRDSNTLTGTERAFRSVWRLGQNARIAARFTPMKARKAPKVSNSAVLWNGALSLSGPVSVQIYKELLTALGPLGRFGKRSKNFDPSGAGVRVCRSSSSKLISTADHQGV